MLKNTSANSALFYRRFIFSTAIPLILSIQAEAAESKQKQDLVLPAITVVAKSVKNDGDVYGYKTGSSRSSTRTDTPLINVPQSVSVVTNDQIRDQNITSMEQAVRYIAGVNIQQGEGNRDQITIRGNATTADFFIDGARDDVQYFRDFYNIDRIEFLKGPNAMAFGRGGAGGVVNRVSKFADGEKRLQLIASGGSFNNRRFATDLGNKVNDNLSLRLNAMYEKTGTFRQYGNIERYGFNPTATVNLGKKTDIKFGYEHFSDARFSDRGIPSQNGAAYKINPSKSFFGNPNDNQVDAKINSGFATITHNFTPTLQLRNYTRYTQNSKFYQNVYASSAVNSSGNLSLSAYSDAQERDNFTNQTDLTKKFATGAVNHTLLLGTEIARQDSTTLRKTGFFNNTSSTETVSVTNGVSFTPITYRTAGSDNNNRSKVRVYGVYLQDQLEINKYIQITGGVRYDRFEMDLLNKRTSQKFARTDELISPRAGLVIKPQENISFYTSYSTSYLPSSGDQFNSFSTAIAALKPEKFENYEVGAKWDVTPKLNLSAAVFRLDRTNTRANDPNNTGFFILTGESRTNGVELAATGKVTDKWQAIGGYAYQDAYYISTTSSASAGKKAALVPHNTFSLWNKYDFTQKFSAALGVISQSSQFASADNTVRLKGFTRFDGAAYYNINSAYRMQFNVENIFNHKYIQTAHNNNNIQPGSPRAFKLSLITDF